MQSYTQHCFSESSNSHRFDESFNESSIYPYAIFSRFFESSFRHRIVWMLSSSRQAPLIYASPLTRCHQQMSHNYGSSVFFDGTIEGPTVTDGRYYCCTCKRWSRDLLLDGILTHLSHSQRKFLNGRYTRLRSSHLHVAPPSSSRLPPWTTNVPMHFSSRGPYRELFL